MKQKVLAFHHHSKLQELHVLVEHQDLAAKSQLCLRSHLPLDFQLRRVAKQKYKVLYIVRLTLT